MKICSKCETEKDEIYFTPSRLKRKNGWCKICVNEHHIKYYQENKNRIEIQKKSYRRKNETKVKEYQKNYNETHKEASREYQKSYRKARPKNDPSFKLRKNVSGSVWGLLKRNNSSKNRKSCLKYLPWTFEELKQHLESLFESWMTWENRGKYNSKIWNDNDPTTWRWQLDHIIPHSTFNYTSMDSQEFRDCWALSNLRPLSAKQNFLDGVTRARHPNG